MGAVGKGIKKAFVGTKGKPETFVDPSLDPENLAVAKQAFDLTRQIGGDQSQHLLNLRDQISRFEAEKFDPEAQANQEVATEIARRRRALGQAAVTEQRALGQGIARRGLGGSAAGLFAQQRAQREQANRVYDLESGATQLTRDIRSQIENQRMQRQQALYGLYGNIVSGVQRVTPKIVNAAEQGSQGLLGVAGMGLGAALGGQAGAAIGGQFGKAFEKNPNSFGNSGYAQNTRMGIA